MSAPLIAFALALGCAPSPAVQAAAPVRAEAAPEPQSPQPAQAQGQQQGQVQQGQAEAQKAPDERRFIGDRAFQLKDLQVVKIKIDGKHEFKMWVMDTYLKRMEGMMFLKNEDFKDDEGMLFVFKQPDWQRFWMRNTLVDLDIAYVNSRKQVLNTYTMKALDETSDYSSDGMAPYVLEFRAGILKKKDIKAGSKVEIPATVKAKE